MTDESEKHPILDDPYAKTPDFTWFDGLFFLLVLFAPIHSGIGILLAASLTFYVRAGYYLLRKESMKRVGIEFIGATMFLIAWLLLD
ncbi:hypothetical protein [Thalassobacillus devorans]|uniref:hypothetical protein n=1 Tax=Thalassobacillus devorans TaxID=279813 RepID=UPI000A1CB679|nr:hypothetical protein [Thalassobacillus devorans]